MTSNGTRALYSRGAVCKGTFTRGVVSNSSRGQIALMHVQDCGHVSKPSPHSVILVIGLEGTLRIIEGFRSALNSKQVHF